MIIRNTFRAIALATTCLAPLTAFAQDYALTPVTSTGTEPAAPLVVGGLAFHGDIDLGLGGVFGSHPDQAGRYTGLNTGGADVLGAFDITGRAPWDSGGTRYYELDGENLILQTGNRYGSGLGNNDAALASSTNNSLANNGSLEFKAGDQGIWEGRVFYDAITYTGNVIDSLYTINGSQGFLNNNLAPFGGAGPGRTTASRGPVTAFTIPSLAATGAMQPVQTATRRDIVGGDFKFFWDDWTFTGALRHEHKEGSMEESFDGAYSGTAFALPVDYDTDRYDVSAAYTSHRLQAVFQYTFSHFTDNNSFVTLPYPTSNTAVPYQRAAAYSLPPSNDAHYLTMMLASSDLIPLTRVNLNARVGLEMQNDTFAPNTADPNPAGLPGLSGLTPGLQGTTTSSPNMMAEVYQLKISAASHPIQNVDTRVYYGLDGRSVSLNQYAVNVGGEGGLTADNTAVGTFFVVPQDWLKQNAGLEAGYRILPESNTKIFAGYRFDDIERSNAQVGHSDTNTGSIGISSEFGSQVDGKLSFELANRTGSLSYLTPWLNLTGTATPTYSGAYYQAPMTSEAVIFRADYKPLPVLSGGFFVQFKNEDYNYPGTSPIGTSVASATPLVPGGVKSDYTLTLGPDVSYRPNPKLSLHFFYTFEMLFFNNIGNGACSTPAEIATAACAGSAGFFQNQYTSSTNTIGLSGEWKLSERLTLRGDYTLSYGSVMFGEFDGVFVNSPTASYQNVSNYPDINSLMNSFKLTGTYQLMPDMQLVVQGVYTSFHNNDWTDTANSIQGAGTTAISYLTPGYTAPNYSVAALMAGVKFRF